MSMTPEHIESVLQDAECLFTREVVEAALDTLAAETSALLAQENPLVLGVMNGGVVLLGSLLTRWSFPLQIDYLHVSRYQGATRGGPQLHWLARPRERLENRTVVIVDDILDGGVTLAGIQDFCREEGARKVVSIVLITKDNPEREPSIRADHTALHAPNRYLFGYGMDYHEYLRNARGIFAVQGM